MRKVIMEWITMGSTHNTSVRMSCTSVSRYICMLVYIHAIVDVCITQ